MMLTRRGPILLLWLGLCPPIAASDAVTEIETSVDLYSSGVPSTQGWLRIAPRLTWRLSPRVLVTAAPVVEADSHGDVDRHRLYDDEDRNPSPALLRFERLSLRFDLGAVKVEIGKQPLTWGRTDLVQATDNLTPHDWTDPLGVERLSPWSLRVHLERGRWEGELAVVPRYAPSRLPRLGGRWAPLEPIVVANPLFPAFGPSEFAVELGFADPDFPATTLDHVQTGLRLGRRGGRAEWTLSFYRGFDDAPHFDLSLGDLDSERAIVPLRLTPRFPRLEVVGADGVLLAGAWALRAEAGSFRFPEGRDDDFLVYELDAEWSRRAWRLVAGYADRSGGESNYGPIAPFSRTAVVPSVAGSASLDRAFLPAAFFHLERSLVTEWEASLEAVVGTREGDRLVRLSGSWPVSEGIRLGGELDLVDGRAGSFFGSWRDNDRLRVFARMTY